MCTKSCKERQFLAAHQYVHRIDLQHADVCEHRTKSTVIATAMQLPEALRGQGNPTCLPSGHLTIAGERHRLLRDGDGYRVDHDIGLGSIARACGNVLHGLDDVESLNHLAEQRILRWKTTSVRSADDEEL